MTHGKEYGPLSPGVCHLCGNPTGDGGSLCSTCKLEEELWRQDVVLDDGPFLPDDEEGSDPTMGDRLDAIKLAAEILLSVFPAAEFATEVLWLASEVERLEREVAYMRDHPGWVPPLPADGSALPQVSQLEQWLASEHPVGTPMRAFDAAHAGPLWSEQEQELHRQMGVNIDHTASAADQRNWNGVKAVLRLVRASVPQGSDPREMVEGIRDVEIALRHMAKAKGGTTGAECESLADILNECWAALRDGPPGGEPEHAMTEFGLMPRAVVVRAGPPGEPRSPGIAPGPRVPEAPNYKTEAEKTAWSWGFLAGLGPSGGAATPNDPAKVEERQQKKWDEQGTNNPDLDA